MALDPRVEDADLLVDAPNREEFFRVGVKPHATRSFRGGLTRIRLWIPLSSDLVDVDKAGFRAAKEVVGVAGPPASALRHV